VREKFNINSAIKNLKVKNNSLEAEKLESKLSADRLLHPEPAPNSLISGIMNSLNSHKIAKIDKTAIKSAIGEKAVIDNKRRLD